MSTSHAIPFAEASLCALGIRKDDAHDPRQKRTVPRHDVGMDRRDHDERVAHERLSALVARLEQDFGSEIVVERDDDPHSVQVRPRPDACPFYWTQWGNELIFGMGDGDCRWELARDPQDIDFLEAAVEAAVAGQVSEVFGPSRSQLTIRLPDGVMERTSQASAPLGCLPIPFWTRSKQRRKNYLPYRG